MDKAPPAPVSVRALCEADLGLLLGWLNQPHLRPYYMQTAISAAQVERKFRPRLSPDHPCKCLISELDGEPFGYVQWYLNASFPDYGAATIGETAGVSLDCFIDSTGHLGRGLGSEMLKAVVAAVTPCVEVSDRAFFVGHRIENARAIRCSTRAGFAHCKDYLEQGYPCALFRRN